MPTRTVFNNCDELITTTTASGLVYQNIPINKVFDTNDLFHPGLNSVLHTCAHGGYGGDNGNCYFYNLVLTGWVKIFGVSEYAFRSFSLICDILSILLIFLIAGLIGFNALPTFIACTLLAINPIFVAFGGDFIRTYSFTTFLTLLSFFWFLKAYASPEKIRSYFYFSACIIFAFFSHFLAYYVFAAYLLFALIKRKKSPIFFKRTIIFIISAGVLCVGILATNTDGIADMKKRNKDLEARASISKTAENSTIPFTPKSIVLASFQYFLSYYTGSFSLTGFAKALGLKIIPLIFFTVFLFLPMLIFLSQLKQIKQREHVFLLWLMALAGNLSAFFIMFLSKHFTSLDIRYTIFTMPFFFLLAGFVDYDKKLFRFVPLAFCLIAAIGLIGTFNRNLPKEISFEMYKSSHAYTVEDIPLIKSNFELLLNKLSKDDILQFSNPDDYIFYVLITKAKYTNRCYIDKNLSRGITIKGPNQGKRLSYAYYGTD